LPVNLPALGEGLKLNLAVHGGEEVRLKDTSEVVGMEWKKRDSGAPVFVKPYYTTATRIVGVFFGGVEGTTVTGFSEIDGIFCELGNMVVAYDS
jgi:hypothetical protein